MSDLYHSLYHYKARVLRVVDGDTIDVEVDLGLGVTKRERVRLAEIDAPELRSRDVKEKVLGKQALAFVVDWISQNGDVLLRTVKDNDKYGRFLAYVYPLAGGTSLNEVMVSSKMAVPYSD